MKQAIDELSALPTPTEEAVRQILGAEFVEVKANRFWRFLEVKHAPPPYSKLELRLAKDEPKGLVVLKPADGFSIGDDDLDRSSYGEPAIDVNPRVPPEGLVSHVHRIGETKVTFDFTARSHRLQTVVVEWEG